MWLSQEYARRAIPLTALPGLAMCPSLLWVWGTASVSHHLLIVQVLPPSMLEEHDTAVPTSVTHGIATSIEALMHGGKKPRTRKE